MRIPPGGAWFIPKIRAIVIPNNTKILPMGEPGIRFIPILEYSALSPVTTIPPAK
jgi:hypothetical protein